MLETARTIEDIPSENFPLVEAFADAPVPTLPTPSNDDIRNLIGGLSGVLLHQRDSLEGGKLKLSSFKRLFEHMPLASLRYAVARAERELRWMPAPADLLAIAKEYLAPERAMHVRAQRLVREKRQDDFALLCLKLRERMFPMNEIDALPDAVKDHGLSCHYLIQLPGDRLVYRTRETIEAYWALAQQLGESSNIQDERPKRAEEGQSDVV